MRAATKVVKTQQSGTVVEGTEKEFAIAKKKRKICKDITTLCIHSEKPGFVQKPLKYVWCGLDTYFVCRVCIDSNNKPINLNLKIMGVNGVGKKLFSKRHGANQFSLGKNNRSKVLKLPKYQRKEPTQIEIRENTGKTSNFN